MKPLHIETPLIQDQSLNLDSDRSVWLKIESLQPSGSFKIRGIGYACQEYARRGAKRFVSSSAGNAGLAVAYAGRQIAIPVLVVVPETTSQRAKTLIQQQGAKVVVHGSSWQEANSFALSMLNSTDAFLHPFDDPLIWQGYSSIIDEVVKSDVRPDAVALSVGGGGLLCGVIEGLHKNNWSDIPVVAVETEGADSFNQSILSGYRVKLPAVTSIATSLGVRQVCETALNWAGRHSIRNIVVSDRAAVLACERFLRDQRILVEPACGATLSALYGRSAVLNEFRSILVIVCGGVTSTIEQLNELSLNLNFIGA